MAKTGDSQEKDLDQQETDRLRRVRQLEEELADKLAAEAAKNIPDKPE
jgi:hypothetical protein